VPVIAFAALDSPGTRTRNARGDERAPPTTTVRHVRPPAAACARLPADAAPCRQNECSQRMGPGVACI
jgi:hypothetical protein